VTDDDSRPDGWTTEDSLKWLARNHDAAEVREIAARQLVGAHGYDESEFPEVFDE